MNRIALLTIHHTTNFGSALQTYALYKAVEKLGCDIKLLDYRCKAIEKREFYKSSMRDLRSVYRRIMYGPKLREKAAAFDEFVDSYAVKSGVYTEDNICDANREFDTFLVGSDIVWGLNVTGNDLNYFLKFADNEKKKVAFGSSAGLRWPDESIQEVAPLLKGFQHIGVRESMLADWIAECVDKRPDIVVDPTMLWEPGYWAKLADKSQTKRRENYILVYFCDPNEKILDDARRLGKAVGMPVYYINYGKTRPGVQSIKPVHIEDFLSLVQNARYVLSASFHGLLFALYFEREVFYYNRANYSRMESLAAWLGIEDHNGLDTDIEKADFLQYDLIRQKIASGRAESLRLLESYLKS